jgi:hypothetical protein
VARVVPRATPRLKIHSRRPRPHALYQIFPKLTADTHRQTSAQDDFYNCVAWVFGDNTQWWESSTATGRYWPSGAPQNRSLAAYRTLFANRGYEDCDDASHEPGIEKIAVYVHDEYGFRHVAWQDERGVWWSKLGESFDIEHSSVDVLEGAGTDGYGTARIMKRARRPHRGCP